MINSSRTDETDFGIIQHEENINPIFEVRRNSTCVFKNKKQVLEEAIKEIEYESFNDMNYWFVKTTFANEDFLNDI
jgi:hypothetical protein